MKEKNTKLSEHDKFVELFRKTNTDNPNPKDVAEIRKLFASNPQLYYNKINAAEQAVENLIDKVKGTAISKEMLKMNVENFRLKFDYDDASLMEKLLIEQIILCWMRMYIMDNAYTYNLMNEGSFSLDKAQYWERILSSTQNRFLRAIETLARIRKITQATLQVNIAADGGKQVNVA